MWISRKEFDKERKFVLDLFLKQDKLNKNFIKLVDILDNQIQILKKIMKVKL